MIGAPGGTRTPGPRLRRPLLYPTELLPHELFGVLLVRTKRLELLRLSAPDPKSGASAIPPRPQDKLRRKQKEVTHWRFELQTP